MNRPSITITVLVITILGTSALAADPRLSAAAAAAAVREGGGSGASPHGCGHGQTHERLAARLAEFEAAQAALAFSSGFAANAGTIAALVGPGDVVFSDRRNHASLLDGCRLSRADVRVDPHGDFERLGQLLEKAATSRRRSPRARCRASRSQAARRARATPAGRHPPLRPHARADAAAKPGAREVSSS